jgi:hypothetical protein
MPELVRRREDPALHRDPLPRVHDDRRPSVLRTERQPAKVYPLVMARTKDADD